MKNLYLKPTLIGVLCGAVVLLINLLLIFGPAVISDTGNQDGKNTVSNPLATFTPTPPRDDTGFLIVLLFVNFILAPLLIAAAGACSVWRSPAERLSPLQLLLVSAIPGAVSMQAFTSVIILFSLIGTDGIDIESALWHWLPTMASYLLIGTICSAAGGLTYGIFSGRLRKNTRAVDL